MNSSDPRVDTYPAGALPVGSALYNGGPWLVVESYGTTAAAVANSARRQCQARGVAVDVKHVSALPPLRSLGRYPGLVVTLPSDLPLADAWIATLDHIGAVVNEYRVHRDDGIDALAAGKGWYEVGVLQIAGLARVLDHPKIRRIVPLACATHLLDDRSTSREVDFFSIYDHYDTRPAPAPPSLTDQNLADVRCYLATWGITNDEQALAASLIIQDCRAHFEGSQYDRPMRRPLDDRALNRLDLMLTEPGNRGPKHKRKAWMENGARAGRHTVEEIRKIVPGFSRPGNRDGTKGLQKDLFQLHVNLQTLVNSPEFRAARMSEGGGSATSIRE